MSHLSVKGDTVTPQDVGYKEAIARWAANAERNAKIIAFVKDAQDIIECLDFAKTNTLPLAVRCGGHNVGGASSVEGGIVIDLSRYMNHVQIDPEKKLAYVGGGANWEAVDKAAIAHGLATVGGTVNHTGVGGLTLGGGYGWLSGVYGLTIDNLIQATIITANGTILTANDEENNDLFWAIRGGGGNFGIATEFVFKLHRQRETVYAGFLIFPVDKIEEIVKATNIWLDTMQETESMFQVSGIGPDGNPVFAATVFFNGSEAEGREKFKWLLDMGPIVNMTKEIPYEALNGLHNSLTTHGRGVYQKGVAQYRPNPQSIVDAHRKFCEVAQSGGYHGQIIYEYIAVKKINSVPVKATAFRRQLSGNVLINLYWDHSVQDNTDEARIHAGDLARIIAGDGPAIPSYTNYDDSSAPIGTYAGTEVPKAKIAFGENYPRLQSIKKKYDSQNIFNKWFPITPA